ncbi:NADPH:quinone oxidoreductase family protein [Rhizorhabdus sp. FW153]|uniref:NADPH:quinone oxidoreductase family protein n=1 Tax=Rhizorhabdus sp. FW153 TaxID=3400216 RepID=UPI003CE7BE92
MVIPQTMRALAGDSLDGPGVFSLRTLPVPQPGPGEVLVEVEAVSFGYVDGLITRGLYQLKPAVPYVPGAEIVGRVVAVGPDVANQAIGDRVATWQLARGGGAADYALLDAGWTVAVPEGLDAAGVAGMMLDYLTASYALFDRGGLQPGEGVLVLGAAGGVGSAAVRIAAAAGAIVVAGASTAAKRSMALDCGAAAAIDYLAEDWRDTLRAVQPEAGISVVVDPVGGSTFEGAFRSLAKGGRHLVLGFAGGEIPRLPANLPLLKSGALVGVDARHLVESDIGRAKQIWADLLVRVAGGELVLPAVHAFPLERSCEALSALLGRDKAGKIVVTM